jgi:adenylate cyclase
MEKDQLSRKLAVILHADVVGSTLLVQKNETLAHERIQAAFNSFSETIAAYGGKAHEIRGDALVAEFNRASDAVPAAIAFQALNEESNSVLNDDIQPQLRIGISLGEVIIADNTITGTGVVLAQRLEQLAESGGVVVQGSVSETVPFRMPFDYESLGEQVLKGFDQPVRAFSVKLQPDEVLPTPEPEVSSLNVVGNNLETPVVPSIAVLPFTNIGGDPQQEYFSDGITRDIISVLSRFKSIRVVAHHSVQQYKNQNASIIQIAKEQDVRYILEGSIRTSSDRIRINAELINSETNENCWVEQYDRKLTDIFDVQDDITKNITSAMRVRFSGGDRERLRAKGTDSIKAWGLCVMADDLLDEYKRENLVEARRMIEEAIESDPNYCSAWVVKGWMHWEEGYCGWSDDFETSLKEAGKASIQALAIDSENAEAWSLSSLVHMLNGEPSAAIETGRKAVELAPGNAEVQSIFSVALFHGGQIDEAWIAYEKSIKLSPIYPANYLLTGGDVCLVRGHIDDAIELYQRSVDLEPDSPLGRIFLVNALLEAGEETKARIISDEILTIDKTFRIAGAVREFSHDKKIRDRFKANLESMGFVE